MKFENWWADKTPPNVYHYTTDTHELVTVTPADPSPREPDVWLLPGHATFIAPYDAKPGIARVFNGAGWDGVKDHRGEVWWRGGEFVAVKTLGDPHDWGCQPLTVHRAEYLEPPPGSSDETETRIRMYLNDTALIFRDDPTLLARQVLAAWEAEGETIDPAVYDESTFERVPEFVPPTEEEMAAQATAAQAAFDAAVDVRVEAVLKQHGIGIPKEEITP